MNGVFLEEGDRFDKLFSGVLVEPPPAWVDPSDRMGKEHLGPEDTFDGDYGRLLEQVQDGKWLASPRGTNILYQVDLAGAARRR